MTLNSAALSADSLLAATVARYASLPAFIDAQQTRTYAQLGESVARLSNHLRHTGVRPGQRLVFAAANDWPTLCLFWAGWRIGAITCPVNPQWPDAVVRDVAQQVEPAHIWSTDDVLAQIQLSAGLGNHSEDTSTSHAVECNSISNRGDDPATIILSSGSTGRAKAVVHTFSAHVLSADGAAANIPLHARHRWLWSLPPYHVSGLSIVVRCCRAGASIVAPARTQSLCASIRKHHVTHLSVVPLQLQRLLDETEFPSRALCAVLLGGSATPSSVIDQAFKRAVPLHMTYGLTEMASQVTTTRPRATHTDLKSAGHLLPFRELRIDHTGQILVRGPTLCLGYWDQGGIVPVTDHDGWFPTRDRGELLDDGRLLPLGRLDNMFISGGENIFPEEIERVLLAQRGVKQAVVVPVTDAMFGQRPLAFVDVEPLTLLPSIVQQLEARLPRYKLPITCLPWPTDSLPAGWKPDRRRMATLAAEWHR